MSARHSARTGLWRYLWRHTQALTRRTSAFNAGLAAQVLPPRIIVALGAFWLSLGRFWTPARRHADDFFRGVFLAYEASGRRTDGASVRTEAGFLTALARDGVVPSLEAGGSNTLAALSGAAKRMTPQDGALLAGRVLVLIIAGADWRRAFDYVDATASLTLVDLSRDVMREPGERHVWVGRQALRDHHPYADHEVVRAGVGASIDRLIATLPPALAGDARTAEGAFANQLMSEIDRFLMMLDDASRHLKHVAPDGILILDGAEPAAFLEQALASSSTLPLRRASAAFEWNALMRRILPETAMSVPEAIKVLEEQVLDIRSGLPELATGGRVLVMMSTNPRHLPAARCLWQRLARDEGVLVVLPVSDFEPALAGELFRGSLSMKGRLRACLLPAYPHLAHLESMPSYARALAGEIDRFDRIATPRRAAIREGITHFVADMLPVALAVLDNLAVSFARGRPRAVIAVPGTHALGMLAVASARAHEVPSGQFQTLLTQASGREYRPVAKLVGAIDSGQRALLRDYFRHSEADIVLTGYVGLPALDAARPQSSASTRPPIVAFASQPLPEIAAAALAQLIAGLEDQPHVEIEVYSHPRENSVQMAALEALCVAAAARRPIRYCGAGMERSHVERCSILATLYSNLGIQAAAIGKPVIVLKPGGGDYPVELSSIGIGVDASTAEETGQMIADILTCGLVGKTLALTSAAYFADNPQLTGHDGLGDFLARLLLEKPSGAAVG